MNHSIYKNILLLLLVITLALVAFMFIVHRDRYVIHKYHPQRTMTGNSTVTDEERRIARQFSDSTLPYLQRIGMVTGFTQTDVEVIVRVSGTLWNGRSRFFKDSFLTGLSTYTKVEGYELPIKIIDEQTGKLYAQWYAPETKIIYE